MANTTNFGWETPDDTDLVKDGAAAIRTLGSSIDTSLVDLKGGTTGQVLSKATGTDMDFTWVAQDDSNAIQNAIVDAKGDIVAASAADTPARLAVGANGETLVADSSTATGLRYQAPVNFNPVLNSSYQVWQRGTSGTANSSAAGAGYNADRWQNAATGNAITVSRQATNDTTNLPFIQYCAKVQRNSGQTGTSAFYHTQAIETINSIPFVGKTVTVSFYARAGANYSAASSALGFQLQTGTGTDQNIFSMTGAAYAINSSATLTSTWQRFTFTTASVIATSVTQLGLVMFYNPVGTAGANDYYEITGVQIEVGSVATPFKTYAGTIQGELAACMRYYQTSLPAGTTTHSITTCQVVNGQSTLYASGMRFAVPMRVAPTVTVFGRNNNSGKISSIITGTDVTGTTQAINIGANQIWGFENTSSAFTAGVGYEVSFNASAEL